MLKVISLTLTATAIVLALILIFVVPGGINQTLSRLICSTMTHGSTAETTVARWSARWYLNSIHWPDLGDNLKDKTGGIPAERTPNPIVSPQHTAA